MERNVVGGGQLVQTNSNGSSVVVDGQNTSDSLQSGVDGLDVLVVVNVERLQGVHVDTAQGSQTGVSESNSLGRGDTGGQTSVLQSGQSVVGQGANGGQLGQVDGGQDGGVGDSELTRDQLQGWGVKRSGLLGAVDSEVTEDLLGTSDVDQTESVTGDENVTDGSGTGSHLGDLGWGGSSEAAEGTGQVNRWSGSGQGRIW